MFTPHNPHDVVPPVGPLSWGIDAGTPRRLLFVAGQIGVEPSGQTGDGFIEQSRIAWRNVGSVLRDARMNSANIVKTGIFISRRVVMTNALRAEFNAIRIAFMGSNRPASTMIYVHALMDPGWLVEIDAIAAE